MRTARTREMEVGDCGDLGGESSYGKLKLPRILARVVHNNNVPSSPVLHAVTRRINKFGTGSIEIDPLYGNS